MNQRLMTILLSAFLVAAGAAYVVYQLVGKQIGENARNKATKVVVAVGDLDVGTIIKATDLKTADLVGTLPKDAILKPEAAVGRGVVTPIYAGEPVIEKRLALSGSGGGLAATIPAGMRACAVKVDDVVGVAGFAGPGQRVDVLVSGQIPGQDNTAGTKVKTLLQNIEVLSAGKNFQRDAEGKPVEVSVVNLLVTPGQAELLSLATNQTRIQLVLRNPIDKNVTATAGADLASLLGGAPPPEPKPKAPVVRRISTPPPAPPRMEAPVLPSVRVIQVLNGAKQTQQAFEIQGALH